MGSKSPVHFERQQLQKVETKLKETLMTLYKLIIMKYNYCC